VVKPNPKKAASVAVAKQAEGEKVCAWVICRPLQ
jgi:non-ribosomal peptide synthetase component E (peptide arylation enzyme)